MRRRLIRSRGGRVTSKASEHQCQGTEETAVRDRILRLPGNKAVLGGKSPRGG